MRLAPGTLLDRFCVEAWLGGGSFGDVYAARDGATGDRVAVKVLKPGVGGDSEGRFLREARIAAGLEHPGLPRMLGAGIAKGFRYLAMEFLEGCDLTSLLEQGPLPPSEVARILRQVGAALAAAHARGIVHRDVKPSNLFAERADADASPRRYLLLDFGVARVVGADFGESLASGKAILGTPRYLAPEQIQLPGAVQSAADVWALAATAYHLLAGVPPFDAETLPALVAQILATAPKPLRERAPGVPPAMAAAIDEVLHGGVRTSVTRFVDRATLGFDDERPVDPLQEAAFAATAVQEPFRTPRAALPPTASGSPLGSALGALAGGAMALALGGIWLGVSSNFPTVTPQTVEAGSSPSTAGADDLRRVPSPAIATPLPAPSVETTNGQPSRLPTNGPTPRKPPATPSAVPVATAVPSATGRPTGARIFD